MAHFSCLDTRTRPPAGPPQRTHSRTKNPGPTEPDRLRAGRRHGDLM